MSSDSAPDPFDQIEQVLASLFGAEVAGDAVGALRASGVSPEDLVRAGAMPDLSQVSPGQMMALQAQMQQMMASSAGQAVNWTMGKDLALRTARAQGDPVVTATVAETTRGALSVADLWLDTATDLMPAPGPREAWTREQWVERTLATWQEVCAPVAEAATSALSSALQRQAEQLGGAGEDESVARQVGALGGVMRSMAGTAFGMQLGHAVGKLATEALSATDVGLPLTTEPGTALVPAGVADFADGLVADEEQVRLFLAVREAATARLYAHVPWLRGQVLGALEAYAREIRIDTEAVEAAVAQVDPSDPEAIRKALESGMFAPQETPAQKAALESLETLLALVEGWVEVVTARATAPHLPRAVALQEMLRRRRLAGGAAEQVFARLIGLQFRPRLVREAARLWERLGAQAGDAERDAFWLHPDVMPTAAELASPDDFLTMRRAAADMDSEIDADLASLLDGTLGYAEGVREADAPSGQDAPSDEDGPAGG
ncbi:MULTISPECIES: zinc-dependent metalloprotease [unclassified Actinomyces]|uniref:zinc-dependent metalloprotease n=1 Tax=unclassified Actinomyces TaxID=2609248 RepID=UPI002017E098|nr:MULTISPECIES: zinc-dependent metalloprotease [unclassified Actinomyces]MCL3778063.1 zinc-dependent metalloprotease [Actinomyces sp. AC-20-1]MCL3790628.1 zinc-dependent metalloprotease [Actinomyces sp. 187325]MCL3792880.1 zinc-dependent metalloprotease [Actinomyces sp. 186855]MCL3795364.1 zinc-dependent metalloprotease [Actinomyces sp. 217892]